MIGLILRLKQEHIEIERMFNNIQEYFSDQLIEADDLVRDLRMLKDILVAHLDLENKMLYPFFSKCDDASVKKLGSLFSEEMLAIFGVSMDFFERHKNESVKYLFENFKFKNELSLIAQVVIKRINLEEGVLFPVYEKYYEVKK
ncbi:hemerythrin domain-containing protein [Candidatus Pacearchaeota archaeon]|nr:hemerythrin domain-containing protein [Candidatus Pacearchaeota archaeon]